MHEPLIIFLESLLPLSPVTKLQVLQYFKYTRLKRHEHLVVQQHPCQRLFFMLKGCCRFYRHQQQQEYTHWFGFENELVASLTSLVYQVPSRESVQLLEDSYLLYIEYHHLQELFDYSHEWERLGRLIAQQLAGRLEDRILHYYTLSAKEKYTFLLSEEPRIIQRVPMKYISSYLGITPESLSRIRAELP